MRGLIATVALGALFSGCVTVTQRPTGPRDATNSPSSGPSADASADGYSFMHTRDNGEPVRWSTCEPIRYVVRQRGAPDGARRFLRQSIRRISEATGLEFSYEGTTDEEPRDRRKLYDPDRYGDQWAPVLVAYSGPEEYPRLRGGAAGYGGPAYVQAGGRTPRYVSGMVVLDSKQLASMSEESLRAVMMHELAHVVGLGHVRDRGQLMNPVQYGRQVTELQKGDLAGLEAVGDGQCLEPVKPRPMRR